MKDKNIYQQNGFSDRRDYLLDLADKYGADFSFVSMLSNALGPGEDFDGLVSNLEDAEADGTLEAFSV